MYKNIVHHPFNSHLHFSPLLNYVKYLQHQQKQHQQQEKKHLDILIRLPYKSFFFFSAILTPLSKNCREMIQAGRHSKITGNILNRFKRRTESITDPRATSIPSSPVYYHMLIISFPMIFIYSFILKFIIHFCNGLNHTKDCFRWS